MKIGILGSGPVGLTLGEGLIRAGHEVLLGTRNPAKESLQQWVRRMGEKVTAVPFREAAAGGELLVICTNWAGTQKAIESAGLWNFKNKVIVDVTNPLDGKGPDPQGRLSFSLGHNNSAGEQLQAWLPPDASVVKALSCIGHESMFRSPEQQEEADIPTMFICGNKRAAKVTVTNLLAEMGWKDVVDMGTIEMSRNIEPLSILWYAYGYRTGTWTHAFKMIKGRT
jgi:8-hydroxy-5-deazaflavin:NADPH oxidoreductase